MSFLMVAENFRFNQFGGKQRIISVTNVTTAEKYGWHSISREAVNRRTYLKSAQRKGLKLHYWRPDREKLTRFDWVTSSGKRKKRMRPTPC